MTSLLPLRRALGALAFSFPLVACDGGSAHSGADGGVGGIDGRSPGSDGSDPENDGGTEVPDVPPDPAAVDFEASCSKDGWCWENPRPQGNWLFSMHTIDAKDVWAVGAAGTALHFDGKTWRGTSTGTREHLQDVWASASDEVWAVGENGTILGFDGSAWSEYDAGTEETLVAIHGSSPERVFAVGQRGTVVAYDGTTWSLHSTPVPPESIWPEGDDTQPDLTGVVVGDSEVWVGKGDKTLFRYVSGEWKEAPAPPLSDWYLEDLEGTGDADIWALGSAGVSHWNGTAWSVEEAVSGRDLYVEENGDVWIYSSWSLHHYDGSSFVPVFNDPQATNPYGFSAAAPAGGDAMWLLGSDATFFYDAGEVTLLGENFRWHNSFFTIWGDAENNVWVGGSDQVLHRGGSGWQPLFEGLALDMTDMWAFPDGAMLTTAGYDGIVLTGPPSPQYGFVDMAGLPSLCSGPCGMTGAWAASNDEAWLVSDSVGYYFSSSPTPPFPNGVIGHYEDGSWTAGTGVPGRRVQRVHGSSANNVWAVGRDGAVIRYDGDDWQDIDSGTSADLNAVFVLSASNVWIVGDDATVLHATGAGIAAQDLSSLIGPDIDLHGVWAAGPSSVWAVGIEGTIIHNDGSGWKLVDSGTRNHLLDVFGLDASRIWAVGGGGTILSTLP